VPAGQYIESSNPPTVDAQTLQWNLQGPADVSYTLFNSNSQSSHANWLFWAGITAALGATLFIEFIKGSTEAVWLRRRAKRARAEKPAKQTGPAPPASDKTKERAPQWPVFVAGVLGGILLGNRRSRRVG
jgi:hypothetical protein